MYHNLTSQHHWDSGKSWYNYACFVHDTVIKNKAYNRSGESDITGKKNRKNT